MAASEFLLTSGATPATPAAGKETVYINTSKHLATVDDAGLAIDYATGAATAQTSPANPTGTTSLTGVMMGLAGAITPGISGRILVMLSGDVTNNTISDGAKYQLRFGTGAAPANAAALTGTTLGNIPTILVAAANQQIGIAVQGIVTGLTVGTTYWVDVSLAAVTGGTASLKDLSLSITEV